MTDEQIDHYQSAVTGIRAAEMNAGSPGVSPELKMPQAQFVATVALTHAVLALVQDLRAAR